MERKKKKFLRRSQMDELLWWKKKWSWIQTQLSVFGYTTHHAVIDDGLQHSSWEVTKWGGVQCEFRQAHWQHAARLLRHRERLGLKGRLCRSFDAVKLSLQLKKSRLSITTVDYLPVNISFQEMLDMCMCSRFFPQRSESAANVRGLPQFRKQIRCKHFCVFFWPWDPDSDSKHQQQVSRWEGGQESRLDSR